jgi:hypothetical protein
MFLSFIRFLFPLQFGQTLLVTAGKNDKNYRNNDRHHATDQR